VFGDPRIVKQRIRTMMLRTLLEVSCCITAAEHEILIEIKLEHDLTCNLRVFCQLLRLGMSLGQTAADTVHSLQPALLFHVDLSTRPSSVG